MSIIPHTVTQIYSQLFNKYIRSDYFQNELMIAWGSLFYSGKFNEEIRKRLERILQMPIQVKSNWELGFASSVYLYVLKKTGEEVDGEKLYEMLKDVNFYRIPGIPEIPAFLGFTFAMFNEECEGGCKLYYLLYKKLNNERIDRDEIEVHDKYSVIENLLSDYLKGRKSKIKILRASEDGIWIRFNKEQRFVSKEMVFLLLFIIDN